MIKPVNLRKTKKKMFLLKLSFFPGKEVCSAVSTCEGTFILLIITVHIFEQQTILSVCFVPDDHNVTKSSFIFY